jgi:ankyrin repeat protein
MLRQIIRFLQVQASPPSPDIPSSDLPSPSADDPVSTSAFTHGRGRIVTKRTGAAGTSRRYDRHARVFGGNITRHTQLRQLEALREFNWQLTYENHCWLNYHEPGDLPTLRMAVEDGLVHVAEALVIARELPGNAAFLSNLECGSNAEDTPLFKASRSGDPACVHAALHNDRAESLNAVNSERQTPLMLAALHGHGDIVSALLAEKVGRAARHIKTLTDLSATAHERGHQWMSERLDAKTEKASMNRAVRSELLGAYRLARSRGHHALAQGLLEIWRGALLEALGNTNWDADVMAMAIASKRHKRSLKGETLGCFLIDLNENRVLPSLRNHGNNKVVAEPESLSPDAFTQFLQGLDKCMAFLPEGTRLQAIVQFQRGKHCTALSFEKTFTGITVFILDATGHKDAVAQLHRLLSQVTPSAFPALGTVRLAVYEPDLFQRKPGSTPLLRGIQLGKDQGPVFALDHAFHLSKFRRLDLHVSQAGGASPVGSGQDRVPGTIPPGGMAPVSIHPGNLNPGFACLLRNTQSIHVLHSLPDSLTWRAINRKQETLMDYALHFQKTIETTIDGVRHYSDQNTAILKKRQGFIKDTRHFMESLSSEALLKHIETIINPPFLSH